MRNVAVFIESSTQYGRGLLQGIARYAQLVDWRLHYEQGGLGREEPEWLQDWDGDGVVTRARRQKYSAMLGRRGIPVVGWSGDTEGVAVEDIPNLDEEAVGELAATYFLGKGFRHFAFIGHQDAMWSSKREEAFQAVVQDAGHGPLHVRNTLFGGRGSRKSEEADRDFLLSLPVPCAVLCVTDERGAQILGLARECGRAVPELLSILGIDNDPLLCQIAHPPLSSIDTNPVALGTAIAKRLDRLMSGDDPGDPPKIRPVGVVERASTAWEAVADPHLVQALAFVRRSVGKRISVDDVARASGISRRALEYRFQEYFQTTVAAYLRQRTVDGIKKLLLETDFPLPRIADILGIERLQQLHMLFRKAEGCSPVRYRREHRRAEEGHLS